MSDTLSPDQRRLRELSARVQELKGGAAAAFYELGLVLGEIQDEQLWRSDGYTSFHDYLSRAVDVSPTTARKVVQIARHFNLEIAERYGFEKLSKGLRYLELTKRDERPGDLIAAELRNRGPDGRYVTIPFHKATGQQVEEAIALERSRRRRAPGPAAISERLSSVSRALPPVPAGVRASKNRVEATQTRKGEVLLSFRQIPLRELRAFLAAIERELLDDEE